MSSASWPNLYIFAEWLGPKLPNGLMSKNKFARFLAIELENYINVQANSNNFSYGSANQSL